MKAKTMKKFTILAILVIFFMFAVLPMSVSAMTAIDDIELAEITGQAGVSINVDVTANLSIGTIAWGDSDGFTGYSNAGYVGIEDLNVTVHFSGRHDGPFATTGPAAIGYMNNKPITIDVGSDTLGWTTQVRIGLPTAHLTVSTLQTDIFVSGVTAGAPTSTTAQQLGAIYMNGIEILLGESSSPAIASSYNAGYLTIGAAGPGNRGVNFGFDVNIDSIKIDTISYGNTTSILTGSFGAAATAGYIGVTDLTIGHMNIDGGFNIGIGTLNTDAINNGHGQGTITQVNILIHHNTTVTIPGAITGTVVLAQEQELTAGGGGGAGELGNFYIGGLTARMVNNVGSLSTPSIIQIWAH
ncbi:MAG: hypothetical protein CVU51_07865 [Deltaproteobacteria bacterium HGW-Deltaproteobacteria-1]|nr:MAG: hypothetical protein CVU51_07865 [Deltaproteobacteria bacterium HGW-Deltaproteobacteria-1]